MIMKQLVPLVARPMVCSTLFVACAAGLATFLSAITPAGACSLVGNDEHYADAAYASDTVAPSAVTASALVQRYYDDSDGGGCGSPVSSCGSYGLVTLSVDATDDEAPAGELGFEVTVVGGTAPKGFNVAATPVRGNEIYLYFSVSQPEGFSVTLQLRAVDLNGNLGPALMLTVEE